MLEKAPNKILSDFLDQFGAALASGQRYCGVRAQETAA